MILACCQAAAAATSGPATRAFPVFTDPQRAGPDYPVQGEYLGEVRPADGPARALAAQIVALGNGGFGGAILQGGLPGAGWDGSGRIELNGRTRDGRATINSLKPRGWSLMHGGDELTGTTASGEAIRLRKIRRSSPTLDARPPAGAIVLFDGTNLDEWARGTMDARKLLSAVAEGDPPVGPGPTTKRKFRDFSLHVEFRTPFMPFGRSEDRANSGVQLLGRYEVQVLDSFGRAEGSGECGSFYALAAPKVNACLEPLAWQTLDIEFAAPRLGADGRKTHGARATVRLNGVLIHDGVELPGPTTVEKDEPAEGPIILQSHACAVFYRNIWVVERK
jgi:hypothetical protein